MLGQSPGINHIIILSSVLNQLPWVVPGSDLLRIEFMWKEMSVRQDCDVFTEPGLTRCSHFTVWAREGWDSDSFRLPWLEEVSRDLYPCLLTPNPVYPCAPRIFGWLF